MLQAARPPLARLAVIDHAVRAGRYPNAATLARQLEVSPRTVQRRPDLPPRPAPRPVGVRPPAQRLPLRSARL